MTVDEWAQVEAAIALAWPSARRHEPDEVRIRHGLVPGHLTRPDALAAVQSLLTDGRDFPPPLGVIVRRAEDRSRPAVPSATETMRLISRAISTFGHDREAEGLRWLAEQSPHAARAAYEYGWREYGMERTGDPDIGGAVRAKIQKSIAGAIEAFDTEVREQRVLPRVRDRIAALEQRTGRRGQRGLAQASAADVIPIRRQISAPDTHEAA